MPHGFPDWGTGGPAATIHSIQDLGELAARLGSPDTFDRRGNVLWYDDFESGVEKWLSIPSPGGPLPEWTAGASRNGSYSCYLETTAAENVSTLIYKYLPYPVLSGIGFEFSVANMGLWLNLIGTLTVTTADHTYTVSIKYEHATGKFYYWPDEGDWVETGITLKLQVSSTLFHTIKMVGDFANKEYMRLIVNNREASLDGLAIRETDPATEPLLGLMVQLYNSGTVVAMGCVDDIIITQNEP